VPLHGLVGVLEALEYIGQISARPDNDLLAVTLEAHLLGLLQVRNWCGVSHVYDKAWKGGDWLSWKTVGEREYVHSSKDRRRIDVLVGRVAYS
jgi:hypothetical protein